jgi:WD40 repeat protein
MTINPAPTTVRRRRAPILVGLGLVGFVVVIAAAALLAHGPLSPTGSMAAPRFEHTATLLSDGRVLVTGGQGGALGSLLASAELYDPKTGTFSSTGSMSVARAGQTATLLSDGRALIVGGSGLASAELYDPKTGTFSPTGSMTTIREGYTATLLSDGRMLVTGGDKESGTGATLTSAELYDPTTGTFSSTGSMSTARVWHTATRLPDGRVLIAGGENGTGGGLASAELYDPKTGTFSPTGSMTTPRQNQSATLLPDGRVLIAGGADFDATGRPLGNGPLASAELYDPKNGSFSLTGSMTFVAEFYTATLLSDGRVLFAGGDDGMASLASTQLYDPKAGTFASAGSMATGREGHTATLLSDGRVLIAGGQSAGNTQAGSPFASAELYER